MMYVLDTNVLSELRKVRLGKADANVGAWAESVDAADLFISAISVMELELGVLSIERRDAAQGRMPRSWLEQQVLPEFSERTLPVDTVVAQRCARLHVPDRRGHGERHGGGHAQRGGLPAHRRDHRQSVGMDACLDFNPSKQVCTAQSTICSSV